MFKRFKSCFTWSVSYVFWYRFWHSAYCDWNIISIWSYRSAVENFRIFDVGVGIDNFGKSAPYKEIYKDFGLTVENITKKTMEMINK